MDRCGSEQYGQHRALAFQLDKLEEDIVTNFIIGKPLIDDPSNLRTVFKFKKDRGLENSGLELSPE